jgi:hypothetical protein
MIVLIYIISKNSKEKQPMNCNSKINTMIIFRINCKEVSVICTLLNITDFSVVVNGGNLTTRPFKILPYPSSLSPCGGKPPFIPAKYKTAAMLMKAGNIPNSQITFLLNR